MNEHEQTPFVTAFGKALFAVPDPCPWCRGVREYHPTSGGSHRLHSDGCAFFTIQHEHDKAVAALSARVARLEAALTTAYDLVAEAIGTPQYDFRARAKACVESCRETLLNRAALEEPRKGDSTEAAEEDKS